MSDNEEEMGPVAGFITTILVILAIIAFMVFGWQIIGLIGWVLKWILRAVLLVIVAGAVWYLISKARESAA